MKIIKLIILSILILTCSSCGQADEKNITQQLNATKIEATQRKAIMEALDILNSLKRPVQRYLSATFSCVPESIKSIDKKLLQSEYIESIDIVGNNEKQIIDCSIQVKFANNKFTPELSGKILSLELGSDDWYCFFNGITNDLPKSCKQK